MTDLKEHVPHNGQELQEGGLGPRVTPGIGSVVPWMKLLSSHC